MEDAHRLKENIKLRKRFLERGRVKAATPFQKALFEELDQIIRSQPEKMVIVFPSLIDWNIPLFQRPQHLALNLAKAGAIYLYGTVNMKNQISAVKEISPQCYLVNMREPEDEEAILSFLQASTNRIVVHLYSGDLSRGTHFVTECLERGFDILYEYIDELSPDIAGVQIPRNIIERHYFVLSNPSCYVVATADKLYKDVVQQRPPERCDLITNGVDCSHFSKKTDLVPEIIDKIKRQGGPIIGYFGALASWFDYELIRKMAQQDFHNQIVLIGLDYDGSLGKSGILELPNIHYPGTVPYSELPSYAQHFDVSIIPFIVNDVTISTSPIKLFEYMALGMPIVTTALPECTKYENILVANDHQDFLKKVERAIMMKGDNDFKEALWEQAKKNNWQEKAKAVLALLKTK
jgi:teichuronic acid biosynthesis glycosyltransferase TuaH